MEWPFIIIEKFRKYISSQLAFGNVSRRDPLNTVRQG
jgi:hypothetical protein